MTSKRHHNCFASHVRFDRIGPYSPTTWGESTEHLNAHMQAMLLSFDSHLTVAHVLQALIYQQHHTGYIGKEFVELLHEKTQISPTELYGIIDFYSFLNRNPSEFHLALSTNIIDRINGQDDNVAYLKSNNNDLSESQLHWFETSCTGMSDQSPGALINGFPLTNLTPQRLERMLSYIKKGKPLSQWPQAWFDVKNHIRRKGPMLNCHYPVGRAIESAVKLGRDATLDEIDKSALRGRGGAGFKTALKWGACQAANASTKYVICNADEGEPGTFKDRVLLTRYYDRLFEGMLIAAWVTGAEQGYIYLRYEYLYLFNHLQDKLALWRKKKHLGRQLFNQKDFAFDIHIVLGAGAYICGEESALIESLEGKRGIPRKRPPYPATHGLWQMPTVVNNVETFCAVTFIVNHGAEAFLEYGGNRSSGTKLHSVSGHCNHPGIYELPFGCSIQEVLEASQASNTQYVQIAGPSGHLYQASQFELSIDFEHVCTGGSFMIFGQETTAFDICENFSRFFAHESCGFCTPCRVGGQVVTHVFDKYQSGISTEADLDLLLETAALMNEASHCGLGQSAGNCVLDSYKIEPERFKERAKNKFVDIEVFLEKNTSQTQELEEKRANPIEDTL